MTRLLIRNALIATPDRLLQDQSILIEDGLIKKIGRLEDIKAKVIDARGKVVLPGLINAHTHFYSTFARGLTKVKPSRDFQEILSNLWWRLDRKLTPEDCYYSALIAGMEAIRHGTTTIFDHHSSPHAIPGSLDRIAAAVNDLGLRACLCYEVSDRDGEKTAREGIEENLRFLHRCTGNSRLQALFGLHASFTLSDKTLRRCAESAQGFHIHCAEDASDQKITQEKYGKRVVERLRDAGILGPKTICSHAVHLGDREREMLAETQTAVVHNPQSNMNNGVGTMDLRGALEKGVLVGLGTDAMTNDMLEELRVATWLHRRPCVDLLLENNRRIANRYFDRVGQLKEGWSADLILLDYVPPTPLTTSTFPSHLLLGLSQAPVDTTIVSGRILMQNKKLCLLDEPQITRKSRKLAATLWHRM